VTQEPRLGHALCYERARHEVRGTEERVGQRVLTLLAREPVLARVVGARGVERQPEVAVDLLDRLEGEPRVRVGPLEEAANAQLPGACERPLGAERPAVDEIELAGAAAEQRGRAGVVQPDRAHEAQRSERDLRAEDAQGLDHLDAGGQRSLGAGAHDGHGVAVAGHADDLIPSGRTDAGRAQPGGERVQQPHAAKLAQARRLELVCPGVRRAVAGLALAVCRGRVQRAAGITRR
jgi:hypothetical protein